MMLAAMGVGAALGIEGRHDGGHGGAEMGDHLLDHVVAADTQAIAEELGRQMTIAEMPGNAQEPVTAGGGDLGQRLQRRLDGDDAAILELEPVAVAQGHRLGEVENEFQPARPGHCHAAAVALVVVEQHPVGRLGRSLAGGKKAGGADHGARIWLLAGAEDTTRVSRRKNPDRCRAFSSTRTAR